MPNHTYHQATFLLSAAKLSQLPADQGIEIAFAGRSNAGKSSVLNVITNNQQLARTSKTPGRTQMINLFELDNKRRLVDLPGYGYAKVALSVKQAWQKTLSDYLEQRQCLHGLVLVMDSRHPLQTLDQAMIDWVKTFQVPTHILLNKADKLKQNELSRTLKQVRDTLIQQKGLITMQLFSATKKTGLPELMQKMSAWFRY